MIEGRRELVQRQVFVILPVISMVNLRIEVVHLQEIQEGYIFFSAGGLPDVQTEVLIQVCQMKELMVISLGEDTAH